MDRPDTTSDGDKRRVPAGSFVLFEDDDATAGDNSASGLGFSFRTSFGTGLGVRISAAIQSGNSGTISGRIMVSDGHPSQTAPSGRTLPGPTTKPLPRTSIPSGSAPPNVSPGSALKK
jgi:hypothetical protein